MQLIAQTKIKVKKDLLWQNISYRGSFFVSIFRILPIIVNLVLKVEINVTAYSDYCDTAKDFINDRKSKIFH